MALTVTLAATLTLKLTGEMRAAPLPIDFSLTFTKNSMHEGAVTGAVTNQAVPRGSALAPKFALIQVLEGSVDFSWASDGAGAERLSASEDASVPATKLLMRQDPGTVQLYMTTTGPASYRVWLFQ